MPILQPDLILASQSPRRAALLAQYRVPFAVCPPDTEETADPALSPEETAAALSAQKAAAVAPRYPGAVIVACDTLVTLDGALFGKPADRADAVRMLTLLSGRTHAVVSGMTVQQDERIVTVTERTAVTFRTLSPREIDAYIDTGEPFDKAGAYGLQGIGAIFVAQVSGDVCNVIGLPLARLAVLLQDFGLTLL